jgi:hypothetical protein
MKKHKKTHYYKKTLHNLRFARALFLLGLAIMLGSVGLWYITSDTLAVVLANLAGLTLVCMGMVIALVQTVKATKPHNSVNDVPEATQQGYVNMLEALAYFFFLP